MSEQLAELIANHGLLKALPHASIELITGCPRNVAFDADDMLLEEGAEATTFYLIRRGHVALEIHQPGRRSLVIETIGPGNAVGWSWLFPPYRWHFDPRALEAVGAIAIDGACLRNKADADPVFGYGLIQCFAALMLERLQATRLRLLDIYGDVDTR